MKGILSRTAIKYIITAAMVINHTALIFMPPCEPVTDIMLALGYVTAITMSFFLNEGFSYTHDRKRYIKRLFLFAVLSQLPFNLAFGEGLLEFRMFNFLFSLALSAVLLYVMDEYEVGWKRNLTITAVILLSLTSDWDIFSILFICLFRWAGQDKKKIVSSVLISALLFSASVFIGQAEDVELSYNLTVAIMNFIGMSLSALLLLLYNGKKGGTGKSWEKWFFYVFYPVHLLIMGIIKVTIS